MLRSGAPTQLTQVFAGGSGAGPTNVVPLTPTGSQPAGQIAYSTGFTSTNMTPIASGGVAPWGADMNGLLKAQTQAQIYQQAGFLYPYSSAFSTAMSGYPAGAVLPMASGLGLWLNQTDGNTTDPDSSGASGWVPQPANQGVTALTGLTGGTAVLTPNQLGAPFITLAGTLTSNLQVTLPLSAGRTYTIQNNTTGAYTVTVAGATGTGVTISQGTANGTTVYTDGTNWYTGQFNGAGVYLPINGTAVAATKLATARTIAMTGDVSWTSPAFDGSANVTAAGIIAAGAVSLAKMANFQANSLMGNPTGSAAAPSAITLQNGLVFSGTNLGLGVITPSSVSASGTISGATINVGSGGYLFQSDPNALIYLASAGVVGVRSGSGSNNYFFSFDASGRFNALNGGITGYGDCIAYGNGRFLGAIGGTSNNIFFGYNAAMANAWYFSVASSGFNLNYMNSSGSYAGTSVNFTTTSVGFNVPVSVTGTFIVSGTITGGSYNTLSDERLKSNVRRSQAPRDLTSTSLATWDSLRGIPVQGRGLIAQDLRQVAPEYVNEAPDGSLGVDYGRAALEQAWFTTEQLRRLEQRLSALEA